MQQELSANLAILPPLCWSLLWGRKRSFRQDALRWVAKTGRSIQVLGSQHIPHEGPCLLVFNHYRTAAYEAWYTPLWISTLVPQEIHWVMAANWTFTEPNGRRHPWQAALLGPLTRRLFTRLARLYDFTTMPAMPPDPREVAARARAVRQVLSLADRAKSPLIGLSPEGGDSPDGALAQPPAGVGRFLLHLSQRLGRIIPIGAYEDGNRVVVRFGEPYSLTIPHNLSADERDFEASQYVMQTLARQLPPRLRGKFEPAV